MAILLPNPVEAAMKRRLYIDFDQGQKVEGKVSLVLRGAGQFDYKAVIDPGTKARRRPAVVSEGCGSPPSCLRVSLDPSAPGAAKNKFMFPFWPHRRPLPGGESGRLRIGDGRSIRVGFDMKLDPSYDTPIHAMLHFQIVQPGLPKGVRPKPRAKQGGGPVIALNIVPHSKRKNPSQDFEEFILAVRNPNARKFVWFDTRDKSVLFHGEFRKGQWNKLIVQATSAKLPGGQLGGKIVFWLNGRKVLDRTAMWGFSPKHYAVSDAMSVELGAYRTADKKGRQTVYFDNISIDR